MEQVSVQLAKPKTSPKDFFVWLGAMVALYVSVGSFIALLFRYIDVLFPDVVYGGYDPYSGGIRFAIASLIVVFPLYFYLTQMIQRDLRADPEKRELGIRKWLIYITLFVAGVALAIDLVTVLYTFLGGELTNRFLLKALSIFAVIGGVFWYYFKDLKGFWIDHEKESRMAGYGIGGLIVVSVVAGFFIIGSPQTQRDIRIDNDRVSDLQSIQSQIVYSYWQSKGALPSSLDDLNDPVVGFVAPTDPETGAAYGYRVVNNTTFELCATFTEASVGGQTVTKPISADPYGQNWTHEAGEQCFERAIDPDLYPVKEGRAVVPGAPLMVM